ncbi:multicopper oxidase family protein [Agromyces sp. SYSU T00194]|uniref:multicopper oxidase family protein n=1 Tax=Agromyces chitinivorans TaxID=3158560 RepID=UPI0033990722
MADRRITRRQALAIGGAGVGVLALGAAGVVGVRELVGGPLGAAAPGAAPWLEPEVRSSDGGVLDLELVAAPVDVDLGDGPVRMLGYNGSVPGPTLHLRPGDTLRVRLVNALDAPTNLHTHGLVVSAADNSDNPFLSIAPGESFDYEIALPDDHPHGTYWYHPHRHGSVADQLFAGLAGAIVVDEDDWSSGAPRVVVVSDVTVAGGAVAAVSAMERMQGRTGETLLANARVAPAMHARPGAQERLLLVNACTSRYLDLGLAGLSAAVRRVDSGAVTPPAELDRLVLAPGNRADLVVTVPEDARVITAAAYDRGAAGMGMMGGTSNAGSDATVLTLVPDASAESAPVAEPVADGPRDLRGLDVDTVRTLTLSMGAGMGMGGGMGFAIDGRSFDPDRVDQSVRLGTLEEWTIRNDSPMSHPFHLHIWPMQVVRAGGRVVDTVAVRDVVDVPAGGEVVVRIAFDRFPDRTVFHCHILDHEDLGMMGVVEATAAGG